MFATRINLAYPRRFLLELIPDSWRPTW